VAQSQDVPDFMDGNPIQLSLAKFYRRVKSNPSLKSESVGKLRTCCHIFWLWFEEISLPIRDFEGTILAVLLVPGQIEDFRPEIHSGSKLRREGRIRRGESDSEVHGPVSQQL
jgi:hypothetical protein